MSGEYQVLSRATAGQVRGVTCHSPFIMVELFIIYFVCHITYNNMTLSNIFIKQIKKTSVGPTCVELWVK